MNTKTEHKKQPERQHTEVELLIRKHERLLKTHSELVAFALSCDSLEQLTDYIYGLNDQQHTT